MSSSSRRVRGSLGTDRRAAAWQPGELEGGSRAEAEEARDRVLDPALGFGDDGAPEGAPSEPEPQPEPESEPEETVDVQAQIDNAYRRGYDDGRAEGIAVEASRIGSALGALEQAVEDFEAARPSWMEAAERNLVALATAIAREIIGRELRGSAEDITALVREAINEFPLEASVRVRLNPADLTAISSPLGGDVVESRREVRWVPDPNIATGGCMVEGPEAIVDGRVEKALERVYSELVYG